MFIVLYLTFIIIRTYIFHIIRPSAIAPSIIAPALFYLRTSCTSALFYLHTYMYTSKNAMLSDNYFYLKTRFVIKNRNKLHTYIRPINEE